MTLNAIVPAPLLGRSLQTAVPAALAVNTKLVDIAHSNVSAGLELARLDFEDWEEVIDPGGGEQPEFDAAANEIAELVDALYRRLL